MKKWLIVSLVILALVIAGIYFFIPSKLEISKTAYINVPSEVAYRNVSEGNKWIHWWPVKPSPENTRSAVKAGYFVYNEVSYTLIHKSMNAIEILILSHGNTFNSTILIIPLKKDSTALHWKCVIQTGSNPFKKIQHYQQAKSIKKYMDHILNSLQSFLGKNENIYGFPIERAIVTDTLLVTTKVNLLHYPSTAEVYDLINRLKLYISGKEAKETNYPMLHILKTDSTRFQTMVAIPVNKVIENNGNFIFKRMVPGNILVAEVKGGSHNIENAFTEMETYVKDHELTPPAIPFESLVTNRMNEPDTTKWITRIYFPFL